MLGSTCFFFFFVIGCTSMVLLAWFGWLLLWWLLWLLLWLLLLWLLLWLGCGCSCCTCPVPFKGV